MRFVRGRVLDLGCGAGRLGLHLQSRGHEVVGIDVSPLAVEIARQRGLADARLGTLDGTLRAGERFDTILLLGNNLGLLAGEYDVQRERQVGNFPQAFSHLTLVDAAYAIAAADAPAP